MRHKLPAARDRPRVLRPLCSRAARRPHRACVLPSGSPLLAGPPPRSGSSHVRLDAHRRRGPRVRAPSRNRPTTVAIMSSRPSGGNEACRPTIRPIRDSVSRVAGDVPAHLPARLRSLEQLPQRFNQTCCSKRLRIRDRTRSRARITNRSPTSTSARTALTMTPSSGATSSMRAAPQPRIDLAQPPPGRARPAAPRGSGSIDTPSPWRHRRPRRRRSCSPALPAERRSEPRRRGSPMRPAAAAPVVGPGSDIIVFVISLDDLGIRCYCLITSQHCLCQGGRRMSISRAGTHRFAWSCHRTPPGCAFAHAPVGGDGQLRSRIRRRHRA